MRTRRKASPGVIGDQPLIRAHAPERRLFGSFSTMGACSLQQRSDRAASFLDLPERIAPMLDILKRIERADTRESDELFPVQLGNTRNNRPDLIDPYEPPSDPGDPPMLF
jgi:hypothetical protein